MVAPWIKRRRRALQAAAVPKPVVAPEAEPVKVVEVVSPQKTAKSALKKAEVKVEVSTPKTGSGPTKKRGVAKKVTPKN
tara:strand:+ start:1658 stop:1894 length:237 start_codon:yes stop_codon:yes gene_type:complete